MKTIFAIATEKQFILLTNSFFLVNNVNNVV